MSKKPKKYCFKKDDDCHLYLVPLELAKKFDKECEKAYANDDFDKFNDEFGEYRADSSLENYSFENPEEIE